MTVIGIAEEMIVIILKLIKIKRFNKTIVTKNKNKMRFVSL